MSAAAEVLPAFEEFLAQEREKDLLRFLTCGSVDDGKSTLIGRLLYDSRNVFEDQVHAAARASRNRLGGGLDLSLLTDGLRAEREQGITIDVAYRYFATARRKFIVADTPGHEQYTRNMATGASTADLAILLIDAKLGVLAQSRRHAYICSLLGIRRYVVAVNKMDLAGYDKAVFDRIRAEFSEFLEGVGVRDAYFLPMSALAGDNVVHGSGNMPWFHGPSLLDHLETIEISDESEGAEFRMPVQRVIRPNQNFRGYAGRIAAGTIRPGNGVMVLPAGLHSRIRRIVTFDGDLKEASAPTAVTLELEDHLDISRGDLLCAASAKPHAARRFEAQVVWMDARPLDPRRKYLIKHTSQTVAAEVTAIRRVDVNTLQERASESLETNAIGLVEILAAKPLFFDAYSVNRTTGSFIVIDPETNATSGAGMIVRPISELRVSELRSLGPVTDRERRARWGHRGAVIHVASRAIADSVERALFERGCAVAVAENEELAAALESAGMLAVLISPREDVTADTHAILHELEQNKVLRPREVIRDGGGI